MENDKKKLIIVGSSLSKYTGFSYVASSFLKRFHTTGEYDITYCTLNGDTSDSKYFGIWGDKFVEDFKNLRQYDIQVHDEKVFNQFDKVVEYIRPDIVLIVADIWTCESIILSQYRSSFMLVMYTTIEVPVYPEYAMFPTFFDSNLRKPIKNLFKKCDLVIPVTNMGKIALEKIDVIENVCANIYNGLDIDKRFPIRKTKKEAFGDSVSNDDFMFMSVSENSDRKILDRTLYTFKRFLETVKDKKKFKLYLHSNFNELRGGTDLVSLIINNNLRENVLLSSHFLENKFMTTDQLYERYAASDCYLALTGGEGFGYGIAESLMHKVPVVYIDYGGYVEFMKDFGFSAKVQTYLNAKNIDVKWGLVDIEDAVKQMQYVVNNPGRVQEKVEAGFKWACNNLDWNFIFNKLKNTIENKYKNFEKSKILLKQII